MLSALMTSDPRTASQSANLVELGAECPLLDAAADLRKAVHGSQVRDDALVVGMDPTAGKNTSVVQQLPPLLVDQVGMRLAHYPLLRSSLLLGLSHRNAATARSVKTAALAARAVSSSSEPEFGMV